MSAGMLLVIAIMAAIAMLIIVIVLWSDVTYRRDDICQPTAPSPTPHRTGTAPARQNIWYPLWTHAAPPRPFSVDAAHRVMREHRECLVVDCPRKHAAYRTLVDAGDIVPRQRRAIVR